MSKRLAKAVYAGKVEEVRRILHTEIAVDFSDPIGEWEDARDLVDVAAIEGHVDVLRELLAHGATNRFFVRSAIYGGHSEVVAEWIRLGESVTDYDDGEKMPLIVHASGWSLDIVRMLVEAGADVNAMCPETGETVLTRAIDNFSTESGRACVNYVWPLCAQATQMHATFYAASSSAAALKLLVEQFGVDIHAETSEGRSPMDAAIEGGSIDSVKYLIEKGANVWLRSKYHGCIPVDLAIKKKKQEIAQYLQSVLTENL